MKEKWRTYSNISDNMVLDRFEVDAEGHVDFSEYKRAGGLVTFMHTGVPKALNGKGIGSPLARGLLDLVRAEGGKVWPLCPFVQGYIEKHPKYRDLPASPPNAIFTLR